MRHEHRETLLAEHNPEWGEIGIVHRTPFNRSLLYQPYIPYGEHSFIWKGTQLFTLDPRHEYFAWAVSPDGQKFAYAKVERTGERGEGTAPFNLRTTDGRIYPCDLDMSPYFYLSWLSDNDLAWGHKVLDYEKGQFFLNGEDATEQIELRRFLHGRYLCTVVSDFRQNRRYIVYDHGEVREFGRADSQLTKFPPSHQGGQIPTRKIARGKHRLVFGGVEGHSFLGFAEVGTEGEEEIILSSKSKIWSNGGRFYLVNRDGSKIAYCGLRYDRLRRLALMPYALLRLPFEFVLALLSGRMKNPYYSALRYVPVNNGRDWSKQYRKVKEMVFTPADGLAAIATSGQGEFVAVDEEDGFLFDAVYNLCPSSGKELVSYIGRRGNNFYRVEVF